MKSYPRHRNCEGAAIIIVLSMVVLLAFLVIAFLSRASLERQVSYSSLARGRTRLLARSISSVMVEELLNEMRYGNLDKSIANATLSSEGRLTNSFPSSATNVVPRPVLGDNAGKLSAMNLVKMSLDGKVSYTKIDFPDGPVDGDKVAAWGGSTKIASRNGRSITAERWNYMGLLPETSGFTPPDWIRITRRGPEKFGSKIPLVDARDTDNANYVIGRYAYVMANLGGMLDVNMLGNGFPVSDSRNATRRRLHQADFTALRGSSETALNESAIRTRLVQWRWKEKMSDEDWLFEPTRSFLRPEQGHNLLFSRNELLAFQKQNSDILNFSDLAYLTVGSYERNQPAFDKENHNASGYDKNVNQSIARTLYTLGAKKGQRIFSRRFNLNHISLLKNGEATDIRKYFGLRQNGSTDDWIYIGAASSAGKPIRTLSDIASDSANPEPNFFEILKAVINQNTLGIEQDGGRSGDYFVIRDQGRVPDYQIFQIGANIIDQWDSDDDPTCIQSSLGDNFWGVENLPSLNQVFHWCMSTPVGEDKWPTAPLANRRFNNWFIPELWNPHRNAADSSITEFRFVGAPSSRINITLDGPKTVHWNAGHTATTGATIYADITATVDINKCSIVFNSTDAANGGSKFSEPSIVRDGTPDIQPGASVTTITGDDSYAISDTNAMKGATNKNFLGIWAGTIKVPDEIAGGVVNGVDGITLTGATSFAFELQYKKGGSWRTYQRMERFLQGVGNGLEGGDVGMFNALLSANSFAVSDPRCHRATRSIDIGSGLIPGESATRNANTVFYYYSSTYSGVQQANALSGPFPSMNLMFTQNKLCGTVTESSVVVPAVNTGNQPGLITLTNELSMTGVKNWPMPVGAAWNTGQEIRGRQWVLKDVDNLVRFGDAATLPLQSSYSFTVTAGNLGPFTSPVPALSAATAVPSRPIVLNRPFRNIGELGYVLRDQPWKTLNFSLIPYKPHSAVTPGVSGDSGLLEVFSLIEADEIAGKVDLNTRNTRVLEAILRGSESWIATSTGAPYRFSDAEATTMAQNMTASTTVRPLFNVSDLATYVTTSSATVAKDAYNNARWIFPPVPDTGLAKEQLEAPLRSLSALGTTRTWNLGVDLIIQVGKYAKDAADENRDFLVEAQQRYFITLIFDRFNGELISSRMEPVYE